MASPENGNTEDARTQPLVANRRDRRVSVRTGVPLIRTVRALLDSDNHEDNEKGVNFIRKIMAILVLQFSVVLLIVSPFCLVDSIKQVTKTYMLPIGILSLAGIVSSIWLVFARGETKIYAQIALFSLTIFFALGLGSKLALASWSGYALVALGQAGTNFALLHAVLQFDSRRLKWLTWKSSGLMCLGVSGVWVLVMRESGSPWWIAAAVAFGGWCFAPNVIWSTQKTIGHRLPDDEVRAAIFILGPSIPDFLLWKNHDSVSPEFESIEEEESAQVGYGGVGVTA